MSAPYTMTVEQETEMLARHRLKPGDLSHQTEKCSSVLDDVAYEVEGLAEAITHSINDISHSDEKDARQMADSLMAFARSLGDVAARMMRYAGRLEAYRDAQQAAENAEHMVEAWKNGDLGNPPAPIEVGRSARRMHGNPSNQAEVTS